MHPELYKAAMEGNPCFLSENGDQFGTLVQVTPNKNTDLHVGSQFHDKPEIAEKILTMEPALLTLVNSKGETALHIAARHGHSETVKSLLTFSKTLEGEDPEGQRRITKEMMAMGNEEKDTALLEAIRYNHLNVLKLLLEEKPKLANIVNASMETPLYLAAEKDHHELVEEILKNCESPAYTGSDGKTSLHAAAIRDCVRCTKLLMDYGPKSLLVKKTDKHGWTPLHYAAHRGYTEIVSELLAKDSSMTYIFAIEDENHTALHLAARQGDIKVMKQILTHCPDCWEMVNSRNQNILHLVVESGVHKAIRYILKQPWFDMLINEKDIDGNTPLHLLCAFNMFVRQLINDCRADKIAFNKLNLTPLDIEPHMIPANAGIESKKEIIRWRLEQEGAQKGWRNLVTKDEKRRKGWNEDHVQQVLKQTCKDTLNERDEWMEKYNNRYGSHVIVASLIATVAFAAGFTVPGGYNGNEGPQQGMAVLARKAAFKAFLLTDTVALMSSSFALFLYFFSSRMSLGNLMILPRSYRATFILNHIALGAMVSAFVTGTITVLQHSYALILSICVMVFFFLFIVNIAVSTFIRSSIEARSDLRAPIVAYNLRYWCGIPPVILLQVYKIPYRCIVKVIKLAWQGVRRSCNK